MFNVLATNAQMEVLKREIANLIHHEKSNVVFSTISFTSRVYGEDTYHGGPWPTKE